MVDEAAHMLRALRLAERGRGRTSPNPMVGAVIVDRDGVVVGRGYHAVAGGPHAEIQAIADAGERARGSTLYCTLEPCCHTGRTGPCAPEVVEAGIRRAVIATADPNPLVGGAGIRFLRAHGVDVHLGVMADRAERLNRPFFTRMRKGRPLITLKAALTLDACVAEAPGVRTPITGAEANRYIHRERAEVDAIAVGSGTLLTDDPLLTPRGAYRYRPLTRVIFDRRLRTPTTARVLSTLTAGPVIIVSTADVVRDRQARARALESAGARLLPLEGAADSHELLRVAVRRIAEDGCLSLVVEGGPTLQQAFWAAGLADRLELFVTPRIAGPGGVVWDPVPTGTIAALVDQSARPLGVDVLIEGYVHRPD